MRKYLARRAVYAVVTLLGVSLSVFVILRVLPGDPLVAILGVEGHASMKPADRVRIMADLGLSDPLPVQYVHWLGDIAAGRLGKSFFRGDTVAALIAHRGPISADVALVRAGGRQRGLRAHGPGQGLARGAGGDAPCAAQRAAAGDHDLRRAARLRAGRLGGGGAGLRRAGPGPGAGYRGGRARHHRGAEPRAALRGDLRGRQRAGGSELRVARPTYPV